MNEKTRFFLIGLFIGIVLAALGAGLIGSPAAGEVALLNQRYDQLDRDYTSRQREIESGLDECIRLVENARGIIERTGDNTGRAVGNLKEAGALIKQGIEERENLKMELGDLRAGLYRLRGMGGGDDRPVSP